VNCFPELIFAMFVDGELSPEETPEIESHLSACAACRLLVKALQAENRALASFLGQAGAEPARVNWALRSKLSLLKTAATFIGVTFPLSLVLYWGLQQLPAATDWLNPLRLSGQLNLLFQALFYLNEEGSPMLSRIMSVVNAGMLGVSMVAIAALFWRHRARMLVPSLYILMIFSLVVPGFAIDMRCGKRDVVMAEGEVLDDTLLAAGDTVHIDGTINGDLIAFARRVEVRGDIKGDFIVWAQRTEVTGTVEGNIYSFAQFLTVRGQAARSIYGWVQSLQLSREGRVGADIVVGAADLSLDGQILHNVLAYAGSTDLSGSIGRNMDIRGGKISLAKPARVGGNVTVQVKNPKDLQIAPGVSISGSTETRALSHRSRFTRPRFYFWQVVGLLGALLTGWLMLRFTPEFFRGSTQAVGAWWRSLGLGFAILIGVPFSVILVGITLVGLPLALLALGLYLAGLYLTKIIVAGFLGRLLLEASASTPKNPLSALLLGLLILAITAQIPWGIGLVLRFAVLLFGLGALSWQLYRTVAPMSS
jgi:cytoskeletal protein CcmA (bactofilin family)